MSLPLVTPKQRKEKSVSAQIALTYGCTVMWIGLSAMVMSLNKYILAYSGFPFPISLTLIHMAFCTALAFVLTKLGVCGKAHMGRRVYIRNVLPIAALFAVTLWMGNSAYNFIPIALIQMMKALMPAAVYIIGVFLRTEKYSLYYALNVVVVTLGMAAASYGECFFNLLGVIFQGGSILTESSRLVLIQVLLQQRSMKLNPITTLSYIAPACFGFLLIPFIVLELPYLLTMSDWSLDPGLLLLSAATTFALHVAVFLVIGRSSALTMNVAGVIKDWLLLMFSFAVFGYPISGLQILGYAVAFLGVGWYNFLKYKAMTGPAKLPSIHEREPQLSEAGTPRGGNHPRDLLPTRM